MGRTLLSACAAATLALATAAGAGAAAPRMYHTIRSTHGFAEVTKVVGCERAEVMVSSSVAMYAAQPGPVGKQGLTGVFVRVVDECAAGADQGLKPTAGGGGGGAVVFEADAQGPARLVVDSRLTTASVRTTLAGTDSEGNPVTVAVNARWLGTGPLEHSTVRTHVLFPKEGVVGSNANDLRRPATAWVTVTVAGRTIAATSTEAVLEQSKWHCIENPRPGVEGFYPCFGFPG